MGKVDNQQIMSVVLGCNNPFKAELNSDGLTIIIPYADDCPFNELKIQFFDAEQHLILVRDGYVIAFEKVVDVEGDSQYYDTVLLNWLKELK